MTADGTVITVVEVRRLEYSRNGNPRWLFVTDDGDEIPTAADHAVGFVCSMLHDRVSETFPESVRIWRNRRGHITDMSPVTPGDPQ